MSAMDEKEIVAINAESGSKRKSPEETSGRGDENSEAENSPNKRIKSGDPVVLTISESNPNSLVKIKTEPADEVAGDEADPSAETSSSDTAVQVKAEPTDNGNSPAAAMVKTEPTNSDSNGQATTDSSVSSSSTRTSCRFGIRCYRRNPAHRSAEAHPGDLDYRRPDFPEPPLGTPACPYGNACYRRNPVHFQEHAHPSDFNSAHNIRNRLRQRRAQRQNDDDSGTDEDEDPFGGDNDNDADYRPGADIDEDEDDELEFESQRINSDDYD
ncbi:aprataxin and PNK-like factor [Drosophila rhopaloa]|uniref:Aprataxin and PNK-like factor n=1 Tax=Drosophila rhopaloa TaxID=1041015 RepID=A0A6P4EMC1_DRORH|nr:aprataxin and PNK-like factor [Drosophila rhopaloa]